MRQIRQPPSTQGGAWLAPFITELKQADLSPRTVAGYQDDLERFLRWFHKPREPRYNLRGCRRMTSFITGST